LLYLADQSLTGRASDASGAASDFTAWIGLVAAVEALLSRRTRAAPEQHSVKPGEGGR
jgi:hypothetical protein